MLLFLLPVDFLSNLFALFELNVEVLFVILNFIEKSQPLWLLLWNVKKNRGNYEQKMLEDDQNHEFSEICIGDSPGLQSVVDELESVVALIDSKYDDCAIDYQSQVNHQLKDLAPKPNIRPFFGLVSFVVARDLMEQEKQVNYTNEISAYCKDRERDREKGNESDLRCKLHPKEILVWLIDHYVR